jgi:hypothetical protein
LVLGGSGRAIIEETFSHVSMGKVFENDLFKNQIARKVHIYLEAS